MRWMLLLLAIGCGGTSETLPVGDTASWTGLVQTSAGRYTATMFLFGDDMDAGYYAAEAYGVSGRITGPLSAATIHPDTCDGGFPAVIALDGAAAALSYSGATCADAGSGAGTLLRR